MAFRTISEIRQFNEDARRLLDELKRQREASATSIEASHPHHPKQSMDRATLRRHLALAEEHVAKGQKLVARQRETAEELERDSHAIAASAWVLLEQFEELQAAHIADRDKLVKRLSELK